MSDLSSYNLFNLFKNDKLTFLIKIALVYHSSLSSRFSRSLVLLDTSQTLKKVKLWEKRPRHHQVRYKPGVGLGYAQPNKKTRNSLADEIGERYAWTTPWLWNFTTPILSFSVTFAYLIGVSWLFNITPYKFQYSLTFYLLMSYLLINIYGSSTENTCELTKIFIRKPTEWPN